MAEACVREAVSHKGGTSSIFLAASAASCAVTTLRRLVQARACFARACMCVCATRVAHAEKDRLDIFLLDRLDQLHSLSVVESVLPSLVDSHKPPTQSRRRRPKLAARRSAVLRTPRRLPERHAQRPKPPRIRPGPGKAAARRHQLHGQPRQPSAAASMVPPVETDLDAPSPRGHKRRAVGPCLAGCAAQPGGRGREPTWAATAPSPIQ